MANPSKPKKVAAEATWNKQQQLWTLGITQNKKPVGEWKWWYKNGSLYVEAFYDEQGKRHGTYKVYHTNGEVFENSSYKNGVLHGIKTLEQSRNSSNLRLPRNYHWSIHKVEYQYSMGFLLTTKMLNRNGGIIATTPKNVPKSAIYNRSSQWEFGEYQNNAQHGKWKTWRADGSLVSKVHYVKGKLHGTYQTFHNDKEEAFNGQYKNGVKDGFSTTCRSKKNTDQSFPYNIDKSVWKFTEDHKKGQLQETLYYKQDGSPCNRHGNPLPEVSINYAYGVKTEEFVEKGLKKYIVTAHDVKETSQLATIKERFEALWGIPMPQDLAHTADLFHQTNYPKVLNYQSHPIRLAGFDDEEMNVVEEAILNMQKTFPAENIIDWFTGTVCFDAMNYKRYNKTYSFQYGLFDKTEYNLAHNQIYKFDYNSPTSSWGMSLNNASAKNLSALMMLYTGADAFEYRNLIGNRTFQQVFNQTKSQVDGDYQTFRNINIGSSRIRYYDLNYRPSKKPSVDFWNKSKWIIDMLRYNSESPRSYSVKKGTYDLTRFTTVVPRALHVLFASYFRRDDVHNSRMIALAASSPSRIIRDAGALVKEFRDGRNQLGLIRDLEALRKKK